MFHLFMTDEVVDARAEARMLHEVCAMTNGDKRDAELSRALMQLAGSRQARLPVMAYAEGLLR